MQGLEGQGVCVCQVKSLDSWMCLSLATLQSVHAREGMRLGRAADSPRPGRRMLRVRQRAASERGRTGRAPRMTEVTSTRCGGSVSSFTLCGVTHTHRH